MTLNLADTARELIKTDPALAAEIVRQLRPAPVGGLTQRQAELLSYIRSYQSVHGVTPAYWEMQDALGLSSRSGIHRLVEGLEQRGHIARLPGRARSIQLRGVAA